jgi:hypothetical protein
MLAEGYVRFEIATGVSKFNWKGKFFVGKYGEGVVII